MNKYLKEYEWSNIKAMLTNTKIKPKICFEDFKDRLVVITGATSGIGYCTAREYAAHGANLLCINRNKEKSESLCNEIRQEFNVDCAYKLADFAHLSDVHKLANEILESDLKIDVLIHNAGVYLTKKIFTEDDIEMVFQVNFMGSFILNYILKDKLKEQNNTRIIFVNSEGHRFAVTGLKMEDLRWKNHAYSGTSSYGTAKVAQLLSMIKFDEFYKDSNVTINAMHPGNVITNMGENNGRMYRFFKHLLVNSSAESSDISAKALYYLGVSKEMEGKSCKFFNLTTEEDPAPPALDKSAAEELWNKTIELANLR